MHIIIVTLLGSARQQTHLMSSIIVLLQNQCPREGKQKKALQQCQYVCDMIAKLSRLHGAELVFDITHCIAVTRLCSPQNAQFTMKWQLDHFSRSPEVGGRGIWKGERRSSRCHVLLTQKLSTCLSHMLIGLQKRELRNPPRECY